MIDFVSVSAFGLVRRIAAAGSLSASVYLLIVEETQVGAAESDLIAEIQIQLGVNPHRLLASELQSHMLQHAFSSDDDWPVVLLLMDRWSIELIHALDRNVVMLAKKGVVCLIVNPALVERTLAQAPNLRSRLTDILTLTPEPAWEQPALA